MADVECGTCLLNEQKPLSPVGSHAAAVHEEAGSIEKVRFREIIILKHFY